MTNFASYVKQFPVREFLKGESLLSAGDSADTLLFVQSGYVRVYSIGTSGDEQMIWLAGRYDAVPTESLFSSVSKIEFFYSALTDVKAYEINKKDFIEYAMNDLELMSQITRSMSNHYDDLLVRLRAAGQNLVRDKLIYTLHYIASRFSAEEVVDLKDVGLRLTQADIAQLIGTTRETTAIELKKLKDEGIIDYDRNGFIIRTKFLESLL